MASFEQARQAAMAGTSVVVQHRDDDAAAQGGGMRKQRVVVATWAATVIIDDHAANLPESQVTDPLSREQADELVGLGRNVVDERDQDT